MAASKKKNDLIIYNTSSDEEKLDNAVRRKRISEKPSLDDSNGNDSDGSGTFSFEHPTSVSSKIPQEHKQTISTLGTSKLSKEEEDLSDSLSGIKIQFETGSFTPSKPDTNSNPVVHYNKA